ncbi:glutamate racemase [Deinococcus navajonensis]|uniref:Glutamate racemase n=1 Tax=Deinococcus navajonensis TaxID=309884 RepID=A0ABV8XLM6_9DEIO
MINSGPVGVFDSGVGGLSVLAELRRALPHEDFLYLGDTAHVPIGARSDEEIRDLTDRAVAALHARGAKAVVVACNTASAFSLSHLRSRFDMPIIGLVPAVKPAVQATRSGTIGVLATPGTLRGTLLADVIQQFAVTAGVRVLQAVSRDLVPLVEAGLADSPQARAVLREVLTPLADAQADQLVLGCTHYPFLAGSIHAEFGDTFTLVDSSAAVARHTRDVLNRGGLLGPQHTAGTVTYLFTGDVDAARRVVATLTSPGVHNGQHLPAAAGPASGPAPAPLRIERVRT